MYGQINTGINKRIQCRITGWYINGCKSGSWLSVGSEFNQQVRFGSSEGKPKSKILLKSNLHQVHPENK